jgi:hypothetical protein
MDRRKLSDREVRYLCWKIKQGKKLPAYKLVALLDALLAKETAARHASNDNARPKDFGCGERNFLFRRYEYCVSHWMKLVTALRSEAGRRSREYPLLWNEVVVARARVTRSRSEYERHLSRHGCGRPEKDK